MKKFKRIVSTIAATALLTTVCLSSSFSPAVHAVDSNNDDWLHCEGDKILDMYGNEVWLTGANWFGFNCSENVFHGAWYDVKGILTAIADRGIGFLRIPISSELLCSWMEGKPNSVSSVTAADNDYIRVNPEFVDPETGKPANSMVIFDTSMKFCKELGIKVLVDVHSAAADNSGHIYPLWYGVESKSAGTITTKQWMDSIVWLAEKYKNDDTILAYDLKNEPHGKRGYTGGSAPADMAKWDNSTDENNWKYAAETCGNAILKVNPNALVLVEGTEQYPKTDKGYTFDTPDIWGATGDAAPWYGAWWGGNLRGVKDYPIQLGKDNSKLVYSPHDYGPSVYAQSWFDKNFTTQTLLDDYWYDTWAYIDDQKIAPLLIGEWGGHMDGGKNQKWMELLRDYMIENRIHHTFWCINPNSGDTGGLIGNDWTTWDDSKYGLLKKALWQSGGKFIGLDHQVPLGKNGMSVGEYYGNVPSPENPGPTSTPKPRPTPTENSNTLTGVIAPDLVSSNANIQKSFTVTLKGTSLSAQTNAEGFFEIKNVPDDLIDYSVIINKPGYLTRTISNDTINLIMGSTHDPIKMWVGDLKEDNAINMNDVIVLASAFNSVSGDSKYVETYDTNLDGSINMADVVNLSRHFGATPSDY